MNICIDLLWTFIFSLWNYFIANWLFVLFVLIIFTIIAKSIGPIIIGWFASGLDILIDFLFAGTAGLSGLISILGGFAIGALWAMMVLRSDTSKLIAIPNAFFMFIVGTIIGLLPIPGLGLVAGLIGYLLQKFRVLNYFIGFFSFGLLYFLIPTVASFCQGLDYIVNLF